MAFHRERIRKALVFGFEKSKGFKGVNDYKLQLCIDNVDKIVDWVIQNQRQPTTEVINELIGWGKDPKHLQSKENEHDIV